MGMKSKKNLICSEIIIKRHQINLRPKQVNKIKSPLCADEQQGEAKIPQML